MLFAQIDQLDELDCEDVSAPATSEISPRQSRSKTAEKRARRSPSRERHFLREFNDLERRRALREFRATSVKAPTPLTLHTPDPDLLNKIKAVKARYLTPQVEGYLKRQFPDHKHPPLWEKATPVLKSHYWQQSVSEAGGVPFVVNFNPDVIARAEGSAKGAFTVLRDRVRDALKAEFGQAMDFWCALDIDDDGRLHIQGGIIASSQDRDRLLKALKRAGGRWTHNRGSQRQVWLGEHGQAAGKWGNYCVRNNDAVRQQVGQRGVYASGSIKRRAEALYGQDRQAVISTANGGSKQQNAPSRRRQGSLGFAALASQGTVLSKGVTIGSGKRGVGINLASRLLKIGISVSGANTHGCIGQSSGTPDFRLIAFRTSSQRSCHWTSRRTIPCMLWE